MSFMFNPFDYDDQTAINRPKLNEEIIRSVISGAKESAAYISDLLISRVKEEKGKDLVLAFDGYTGAQWETALELICRNLKHSSVGVSTIDFTGIYKTSEELDKQFAENLETDRVKDPVLLFGKLYKGSFEDILDPQNSDILKQRLEAAKSHKGSSEVVIVYGCGCAVRDLRPFYDYIFYFDVTPKQVILRARKGLFANFGDKKARPVREFLRRCYYVDFEIAAKHRRNLLDNEVIDFYVAGDDPVSIKLIPWKSLCSIMSVLVKYPMRCKPVYLEGVWGGQYIKKLRNLPEDMRNCAWVFDLIPLEVSIVVEAGNNMIEFPFFTLVQKEGMNLMGNDCVRKFGGYFPIRFNYDDTWHGSGNMSIQVHSGHAYNIDNFNEHGRQDESYYVVATDDGAKTFLGFNENEDVDDFIKEVKKSEKEFTPVDHEEYINHVMSKPGMQFLIPAGTIHASGRNQVVLEIGSLTVGSYTYKMYDYLRADLDGNPRPIHTWHGERVIRKERTSSWVKKNLVRDPVLIRKGGKWAEYIIGEHDLLYFSLRRLDFEELIEDNTDGKFHVLNLVDGEKVIIQSAENPELSFIQNYLDMVIVPANMGRYIIRNLGDKQVSIHKTMLKDGFFNDKP